MAWPGSGPRRISVNSFGFGGTNAHAVLDDAYHYLQERRLSGFHTTVTTKPALENVNVGNPDDSLKSRLFVWSTSDETGTKRLCEAYREFLSSAKITVQEDQYLGNLAYTLAKKRTLFPYRSYVQAATLSELVMNLSSEIGALRPLRSKASINLGFVFTGQGAQWAQMGIELLKYPTFRRSFEQADSFIRTLNSPWTLLSKSSGVALFGAWLKI
jgi:acyl transferase domain-containing protein